jgi:CubicO group peptidase (beta-lactamase class C family)
MNRIVQAVAALTLLSGASSVPSALHAQAPAQRDERFASIVELTERKMREHGVPGVALGIISNGTIRTIGLGVTNVEDSIPVNAHTVFPIASISKTFAATALMRLVEQGKVDLKAPVRTYLPDFRAADEAAARDVTVWNLLTHSPGWEGQLSGTERGDETLKNFVNSVMPTAMQLALPGEAWSYNNAGFSVAGRVIEAVVGTSINRAMRDLVFTPLGLQHAGTTAGDFIVNRFAAGHSNRGSEAPTLQRPFSPSSSVTAGGVGLCITDLMTYAKFHLGDGTSANGTRVLSRESLVAMQRSQLHKQGTDDDIGLAWHLRTVGGLRVAAHGGTLGGHILLLELAPERDFAIAILTNSQNGWRLIQDVERAALKSYHGATFGANQAIAHRGLVETLPTATPLTQQPDYTPYVGRYLRPMNAVEVRVNAGRLIVQEIPNGGTARAEMPISFFGRDQAVITDGPSKGQSIEFVRGADRSVKWIRVTGRIAVRAPAPPG